MFPPASLVQESVSQVRPLVISGPNVERLKSSVKLSWASKLMSLWPSSLSLPVALLLLLPVSIIVIVIISFLLPWTST